MYPITQSPIHSQQNVVIDNLHLFLWESDVLIDLLASKMDLIKKQHIGGGGHQGGIQLYLIDLVQ